MFKNISLAFVLVFCVTALSFARDEGVDLTIYNQNFGLVKDRRSIQLKSGINNLRFSDVAALIEPTSVLFKSLTDPLGCIIQEQNFEYDLLSVDKLLTKYIDNQVKLVSKGGKSYEGTLLSYDGDNIVISQNGQISMVSRPDNLNEINFAELPEGLITKPTLVWQIESNKAGRHLVETSYLTQGINWNTQYVALINQDDDGLDLSGWVTIDNRSGTSYKDARLKLIAGEVRRAPRDEERVYYSKAMMAEVKGRAAPQFEEKSFFEYHMYTLQRKTTLRDNQTKQISLLSANNISVKKLFIYDPVDYFGPYWYNYDSQAQKEQKIKVKLELKNSKENNLGMPLPKGKIKVYKKDTEESLQFIGEDAIDHTPKDETIKLYLGDAFDVVGERKQVNYRTDSKSRWAEESFEITLRNHKESAIEVNVIEHLWRYANWKISSKSHEFSKKDSQTIEFKVAVPKDGETKVTYTVRYWW